jgi:two-component system, LytTR family, sensor kinase
MFLKKSTYYLLFIVAYIGALIIEKPTYDVSTVQGCMSYLATIIVHFGIFFFLIYVNNTLVIPYLLEKKQFSLYVGALIGLVLLYTILIGHYNRFIHDVLFHDEPISTSSGFWSNFIYGLCCTVITSMLYLTEKWSVQEEQVKNNAINQLQTELKYLRSQINPHFLFNGLNTIYGNIDINNLEARDIMVQFSDLLRYNLYEADVDAIEIEKEIKYLQNYVALQRARSNENMQIELTVSCDDYSVKVAPLIFMAFVENAFKYATRDDSTTNIITIKLTQSGTQVDFECENSYEEETTPLPGGIGLNNVIRRLDLLYKDRYTLEIKNTNNIYYVNLLLTI